MRIAKLMVATLGLAVLTAGCVQETTTYRPSTAYSYPSGYPSTAYSTAPRGSGYWNSANRDADRDGVPNRYDRDANGDGVSDRYQGRPRY